MGFVHSFVSGVIRIGLEIMCRIEKADLKNIPTEGPLICYSNHIGQLEVPLVFVELLPRKLTGFAKIESWDNPLLHWLFNLWGIIPIRRGEADMDAMRAAFKKLDDGYVFGVSPEGTRSKTAALLKAHPGATLLALHNNAPLIPLAHWGGEDFTKNLKRLKRTDFHIRVGRKFYLDARGERVTKEVRQQMVDEMMYELARLLPEKYRGEYADLENATQKYLRFED
jgi:1-acyl-sn-glycerol-3-phosphate acyltransferase